MPGKSITMPAPHWLHLTAFNCNGPHEMSTVSTSLGGARHILRPASLCASHSFEAVQSRCLRLCFTLSFFFAANPEREAKRQRFRFFPAFHALSTSSVQFSLVEFFLTGFPAFCERHKNHVVVVALRLVTLVLHLNDPPKLNYTKFFAGKVFCKGKSESERHSLWS